MAAYRWLSVLNWYFVVSEDGVLVLKHVWDTS